MTNRAEETRILLNKIAEFLSPYVATVLERRVIISRAYDPKGLHGIQYEGSAEDFSTHLVDMLFNTWGTMGLVPLLDELEPLAPSYAAKLHDLKAQLAHLPNLLEAAAHEMPSIDDDLLPAMGADALPSPIGPDSPPPVEQPTVLTVSPRPRSSRGHYVVLIGIGGVMVVMVYVLLALTGDPVPLPPIHPSAIPLPPIDWQPLISQALQKGLSPVGYQGPHTLVPGLTPDGVKLYGIDLNSQTFTLDTQTRVATLGDKLFQSPSETRLIAANAPYVWYGTTVKDVPRLVVRDVLHLSNGDINTFVTNLPSERDLTYILPQDDSTVWLMVEGDTLKRYHFTYSRSSYELTLTRGNCAVPFASVTMAHVWQGVVWVADQNGIYRMDDCTPMLVVDHAADMLIHLDDLWWLSNRVVYTLHEGAIQTNPLKIDKTITSIAGVQDALWVATDSDLRLYSASTRTERAHKTMVIKTISQTDALAVAITSDQAFILPMPQWAAENVEDWSVEGNTFVWITPNTVCRRILIASDTFCWPLDETPFAVGTTSNPGVAWIAFADRVSLVSIATGDESNTQTIANIAEIAIDGDLVWAVNTTYTKVYRWDMDGTGLTTFEHPGLAAVFLARTSDGIYGYWQAQPAELGSLSAPFNTLERASHNADLPNSIPVDINNMKMLDISPEGRSWVFDGAVVSQQGAETPTIRFVEPFSSAQMTPQGWLFEQNGLFGGF